MQETPDVLIFLGRLHPLIVHLPIGFVCLAILIEIFFRAPKFPNLQPVIKFIWLLAALSSTLSVLFGYLLSLQGGYDERILSLHKWSAILLAVLIHVCYFLKKSTSSKLISKYTSPALLGACALLLIITGHFGGSLTHGSDYLTEHRPGSFSEWLGLSSEKNVTKKINSLDSADIFTDAVMPILKSKCVSCHNPQKRKGEFIMDSYDDLLKGGEDGPGIVPGDLEKSNIYTRITLPTDDKKFMPANGKKPLTQQQVAIIKWWIEMKCPKNGSITVLSPDSTMKKTLTTYFEIDESNNNLDLSPSAAKAEKINELKQQGFIVSALSEKSNLLQATWMGDRNSKRDFSKLLELKDQLVWLRISNVGKLDDDLKIIGELVNLRKLTLSNNEITDENLSDLRELSNLEYLNLYNTKISNSGVEVLVKLKTLKQLYIGKTNIDPSLFDNLNKKNPSIKIIYKEPENDVIAIDTISKTGTQQ
ncbi:MAG: hypothetical protein QM764_23215 [Chitinophagaceae bacterium]